MRALQLVRWQSDPELREVPEPEAGPGQVVVAVGAAGACHSDLHVMYDYPEGAVPYEIPFTLGHENAGWVHQVGAGVRGFEVGQPVAVYGPWGCGVCPHCAVGAEIYCEDPANAYVAGGGGGLGADGGMAPYQLVPNPRFLFPLPDGLDPVQAAPLTDAALTPYHAVKRSLPKLVPGSNAVVIGVGGLGHLGVQYAARMGFRTAVIARGKDKEPLARQLGAAHYIDSQAADPAAELTRLGGAKVVLATVTHGPAMSATVGGLAPRGRLMVLGAAESLETSPFLLIGGRRSVEGWYAGTSIDSEDTLAFSVQSGVRSVNEVYPLERAAEAYDRMMSGKARFRVVLTTGK